MRLSVKAYAPLSNAFAIADSVPPEISGPTLKIFQALKTRIKMPTIPVSAEIIKNRVTVEEADNPAQFEYSASPKQAVKIIISANPEILLCPIITLIHEAGHYLDFCAGGKKDLWLSATPKATQWYQAIQASATVREMRTNLQRPVTAKGAIVLDHGVRAIPKVIEDNLTPYALFAHGFVFYAALKTGHPLLIAELNRMATYEQDRAQFPFWSGRYCSRDSIANAFGDIASHIESEWSVQ